MEKANPLRALSDYGQSVWLDYIRRSLLLSGELERLVEEDSVCGVTSNPSIFEKAVAGSTDYQDILSAADARHVDGDTLYERIVVRDIRDAADVLRPVYEHSQRRDGYVSLEVSPKLARDTQRTLEDARRWRAVDQPNLMIKVPATPERAAVRQWCRRINVNVTLLFSQAAYERVVDSTWQEWKRWRDGGDVTRVASVASFFVSRIDSAVDRLISCERRLPAAPRAGPVVSLMGRLPSPTKQTYQVPSALRSTLEARPREAQTQRVLGEHRHQESRVPRRRLRRRADRPRHRKHDPAGHARRIPRSRPSARKPDRERRRGERCDGHARAAGHLHARGDRPTPR
jgi:transaldolase/glucose-6-phosphate isomerase